MIRHSFKQKQNIPYACQPRPSLKMSMTAKKKSQKSDGRMSMLPLKKQRLSVGNQNFQTESRPSLRTNINLLNSAISSNNTPLNSCQRSIRKETIINNLVNKLDEEEEIRSIIQTKLRRNSYGPNKEFMYTSQFQPYSSNNSTMNVSQKNLTQQISQMMQRVNIQNSQCEQNSVFTLNNKLKQCQQELDYFKSIVKQMSKKMKVLQRQQTNNSRAKYYQKQKSDRFNYETTQESFGGNDESYKVNQDIYKTIKCSNCGYCKCGESKGSFAKQQKIVIKMVNTQTQTDKEDKEQQKYKAQESSNYEFDFFDNLDRTLKILSNSKNL